MDTISALGIKPYLVSPEVAENIKVYAAIDSTNREAKDRAVNNAVHGTVIISDRQTHGKGRLNRSFFSPAGSGLYMSFILYSQCLRFENPTAITAFAAVCVCDAIEIVCNLKPSIKWVNDIFLNGKKVGGILTEAIPDREEPGANKFILGIGINVCTVQNDFPEAIRQHTRSLYPDGYTLMTRNELAAEIINRILLSGIPSEAELYERYRNRLFMLGSNVTVIQGNEQYEAIALDINSNGCLLVKTVNGNIKTLSSGEVRIC